MFWSALEHRGLKSFYNLIEQHHTQTEPAFCGVSTLVLVLNALAVDPGQQWKGPWRWYEEKMLNCCVDLEEIKQSGITLQDFQCLAFCQGLSVDLHYCDETNTLEDFRKAVEGACLEDDCDGGGDDDEDCYCEKKIPECLAVSYSRKVLKQTGDGHFSPLAACDKASDLVLILDTARFKYGAHWTKLPLLYEAMKPINKSSGKSCGYVLLSFVPRHNSSRNHTTPVSSVAMAAAAAAVDSSSNALISTSSLSTQPTSILYRSMMNQKRKRERYKDYIRRLRDEGGFGDGDIPYDKVRSYWCEGKDRPSCVWEIIVPIRVGSEEEKEMLQKIRILLVELRNKTLGRSAVTNSTTPVTEHPDDQSNSSKSCSSSSTSCSTNSNSNRSISSRTSHRCRSCQTYNPMTNHTLSVNSEETLYIIYLATLSQERRYDFVMNFDSPGTMDVVRKQIIKEADMIASAIEVSDQVATL